MPKPADKKKIFIMFDEMYSNRDVANRLGITIRTVQKYRREYKEKYKDYKPSERDKKKVEALALIKTGTPIVDACKKTGASIWDVRRIADTLQLKKNYRENLKILANERAREIFRQKIKSLALNEKIKSKLIEQIEGNNINLKDAQAILLDNEKTAKSIINIDELLQFERLDLKAEEIKAIQVGELYEELKKLSIEEIKEILKIVKNRTNEKN